MHRPFRFHIPVGIWLEKGAPERARRIGGIVSTESLDQDDEKILADGLDFGPFHRHGWFNDNHSKDTNGVVGYPDAQVRRLRKGEKLPDGSGTAKADGWWAEGRLVGEKGRQLWELAKDLEGSGRSLGFSIEGKILERDGADRSVVTKAIVKNIAVTHCPVNAETELRTLSKAMIAGSAITNPGAAPGSGFALRAEDLDPETKITEFASPLSGKADGGVTLDAWMKEIRRRRPELSKAQARAVWNLAARMKNAGGSRDGA